MDALEAILTRRSTRRYTDVMPERSLIEKVVEAGRFAPSGGNNQTTHFIVFTEREVLTEMAELVCQEFSKMEADENTYASLRNSISALENMMIAANALDLGSCWINQLHWLDENEVIRQFLYQYGLEEYETVTGALSLGYAEGGLPNRTPLPRKGNPINWE